MEKIYGFLADAFTVLGLITKLVNAFDTHALQNKTFITVPLELIQKRGC
jgi:hypothetical protein